MKKILVVDDDVDVQKAVCGVLERFFEVECVGDAESAWERIRRSAPDLIVLDIMLPGTSGKDFCRELRRSHDIPVIFLSGLGAEVDLVSGLEIGADDYVTKPFLNGELLARVNAVLRRAGSRPSRSEASGAASETSETAYEYGPIALDVDRHAVSVAGVSLELTPIEFDLLQTFLSRPKKVFTRDELRRSVWGETTYVSDRTINSHVRRLREKFEDVGGDPVDTYRGVGYRLAEFT